MSIELTKANGSISPVSQRQSIIAESLNDSVKTIVEGIINQLPISDTKTSQPTVKNAFEILTYRYGNALDSFHQKITRISKAVMMAEITELPKEHLRESLNNKEMRDSIPSLFGDFLHFKESFPKLFEKRNYQQDLDYVQKEICDKYDIATPKTLSELAEENYTVSSPIKDFKGDLLVLGCGRKYYLDHKVCGPHDLNNTLFVSYEQSYGPDIVADYYSTAFWKELPDNRFKDVFLEGFSPSACKASLKQINRILKEDGYVRMYFCDDLEIAQDEKALNAFFKECGFKKIEFVTESFLSCNQMKENKMIYAYK